MSECPVCHKQIEIPEASRGTLFACPECNAVYFITWDGDPEPPEPEPEDAVPFSAAEPEWSAPTASDANEVASGFEPAPDFAQPGEFNVQNDYTGGTENPNAAVMGDAPAEETPAEENPVEPGAIEYAAADFPEQSPDYDFNQPLGDNPLYNPQPVQPEAVADASVADEPTFEDVTSFGNADTVTGPLTYTVIIEGIDTGKIYGELKEALEDGRFRWNVPELVKTIQDGRLEIKDLNPAKAFMLVNRIKYLALKISWRQDVLG